MFRIVCLSLLINLNSAFTANAQLLRIEKNLRYIVQALNDSLKKYTDLPQQVRILNDSVFVIEGPKDVIFQINISHLKAGETEHGICEYGISFQSLPEGAHLHESYIRFAQQNGGRVLKFCVADDAVVQNIHQLFIRMYELMMMLKKVTSTEIRYVW